MTKKFHTRACNAGSETCGPNCRDVDVFTAKNARITIKNADGTETVLYEGDGLEISSLDPKDWNLVADDLFAKPPRVDIFDDRGAKP